MVMKSEFLLAFNEVCSGRGLPREVVLDAVKTALVSAYRRNTDLDAPDNVTSQIDPTTGETHIFVEKEVVDEVSDLEWEMSLAEARVIDPNVELGDKVMVDDTPANFGRIAAQTAKQVILQRIREAERDAQYEHYAEQEGEIVHGIVQSVRSKVVMLNLGSAEAILPRSQQVPGERYHIHQRLRAYVLEVRNTSRGPKIVLSRSHPDMLRRLLELEVPEIFNGAVEIKAISREAGSRSKVAVSARQPGVDPVGACVGMRGVRIKSIVNELGGEKIDVIEWNADSATFIAKALSPAKVLSVHLDEDPDGRKSASVVVPDDQLSLAIGRSGQNARLAAKLSDYRIDIQGVTEAAAWALQRINKDPEVLPSLGPIAERLPNVANTLQEHEAEDLPYNSEDLLVMRRVIEAVWRHYVSTREAEREQEMERVARRAALDKLRAQIPASAYEITLSGAGLDARVQGRLEDAGIMTPGAVMELFLTEGDEGLLDIQGIGLKSLGEVRQSLIALGLLEEAEVKEEVEVEAGAGAEVEAGAEVKEEVKAKAEVEVEEEVEAEAEAETEEEIEAEEEEALRVDGQEFFFDGEEIIDREEKLKRERGRRVQLVYDEETGELVPRRRRKREEGPEDWQRYMDY
jgi:transcription termination/antitermination protein NusA